MVGSATRWSALAATDGGHARRIGQHGGDAFEVVVDEAHNYRNPYTPTRAAVLRNLLWGRPKDILMLSATPVNNRLADLRNQIAFATEGDDTALIDHGISSIDATTRLAQKQFNRWLDLDDAERIWGRFGTYGGEVVPDAE
jgi:hypothetical protein